VYMGICKNEICPGWLLKVREHYVNEGFPDPNHSIPSGPRAAACFIHTSGIDAWGIDRWGDSSLYVGTWE